MIKVEFTGEVMGVNSSTNEPGVSYVKVQPEGFWKFSRPGEMPAAVSVKATDALTKGLGLRVRVQIKGKCVVGVHDWEKPKKFGQNEAQKKKIENTYFAADSIEILKG